TKREESPPSSFYAQSRGIWLAAEYFEHRGGYAGVASKHRLRIRSALLAQLMSSYEFAVKDFLAQVLDATHIFDDRVKDWDWINVDVSAVLQTREGLGRIGAVLIHPTLGWQAPKDINHRYQDVFGKPLVWPNEEQ